MKLAMVVFAADLLARRGKAPGPVERRRSSVAHGDGGWRRCSSSSSRTSARRSCSAASPSRCCSPPVCGLPVLAASGFAVCAVAGALALSATYRRDRLLSFVNPFAHASTTGYQVVQSLATLGLGGVTGSGVGGSVTPWGFLPNAHTDFVFAVIAGNLGLVGALVVLAGFAAFGWAGFRIAARERDPFAHYLAIGVTCWVLAQAVINIGGVVDALPVTGIPLPFISYGGSSLGVVLVGVGVLFGIARRQGPAGRRSERASSSSRPAVPAPGAEAGPGSRRRAGPEPA